ncbi:DUF3999 family protein [Candidatus Magnetominusculus xianensis]|uniref:DUF3999 family protein n=1 Tax=Candidatus Magnetominusculus xianensis TaxID=1748249 RepID=A0ABR5SDQ4_9BACT|nr:DUF3999 family protein [Candidatus Magnetominusculus xianensis]KWT81166.1 hypothetical protein ASN18_2590 [Candidatus Magnetominusculus xianensis]MBF0404320.1 DUF3999 family protein [Nitrospirota bacterium]
MKKLLIIFAVILTAILNMGQDVSAAPDKALQYIAPIAGTLKKGTLYRVHLTTEILQKCAQNCKDLRLIESVGTGEVPYIILNDISPGQPVETYTLKITDYSVKGTSVEITMKMPDAAKPITAIKVSTEARDFQKNAVLYGSTDQKHWQVLTEDSLYDFSSQVDLRKTSIHFKRADFPYYRLKLSEPNEQQKKINLTYEGLNLTVNEDTVKKLKINSVTALTTTTPDITTVYDNITFTGFKAQTTKNTVITIEAALPFNRIYFNVTNPYYNRRVMVSGSGAENQFIPLVGYLNIYAYPAYQTKNFIEFKSERHQHYRIEIENRNNPPLDIKDITFQWVRKYLFFVALNDGVPVNMYIGNPSAVRPDYDLSSFISQESWYKIQYETLKAGTLMPNPAFVQSLSNQQIGKTALRIVVILLVVLAGYWIYRLTTAPGRSKID